MPGDPSCNVILYLSSLSGDMLVEEEEEEERGENNVILCDATE
jgi:hypothetical protein